MRKNIDIPEEIVTKKKEPRGGTRRNAGAKPKYLEPTKTVAFRCPISRIPELKIIVKANLSDWAASPVKN
jgi:hypothetical protein